ncbi:MAG TPA: response regulator [Paracoccaceae bacterium]|nr:response regulator [Paracoccaceae bacterium]
MTRIFDRGPTDEADLRDEVQRQADFLRQERPLRVIATVVAYGMATIYLPPWLVLAFALGDLAGEIAAARLMSDPGRLAHDAGRRRGLLVMVLLIETCFALPPALYWHVQDPYAKALAVAALAGSMMHMASVRSTHLPQGVAGAVAMSVTLFPSNAICGLREDDMSALAVTSFCGLVAVAYFVAAMVSNHRLHSATAAERRRAQAADNAKGRFLAQMSHELRTPLNGILGLAHAEQRLARDPASRERLGVLVASAQGLAAILDDSLDGAAVETGQMPVRLRPGVPAAVIRSTAALFRPAVEDKGLRFDVRICPGLETPMLIDATRLRQCLTNLLANALRHTAEGRIAIDAQASGERLVIEVADSGPGLSAEAAARLFDAAPLPDSAGAGMRRGIGLVITRDLARRMGGGLELLRDARGGTGARFRLEVALPAAPAEAPVSALRDPPAGASGPPAGLRVLVVDDIATNRLVAATFLRLLGLDPVEAASGAEALRRASAQGFDVVLLDLNMPGMDGAATLRALRALPGATARARIVAMTADAMPDDGARCLALGFDAHLAKPVTPETIAAVLPATAEVAR